MLMIYRTRQGMTFNIKKVGKYVVPHLLIDTMKAVAVAGFGGFIGYHVARVLVYASYIAGGGNP